MLKKYVSLIVILVVWGCEDVVEVDVPTSEPKLVIDAAFAVYLEEDPIDAIGVVQLTLSADFFDEEIPVVNDAEVFITSLDDGRVFLFEENGNTGTYVPELTDFLPDLDSDYQLTVVYNGETYQGTTRLIRTVPIDSIEQGDETLFDGDETEIIIEFTDDGSRDDYYLFDFDFNLYLTTEDRFYQGESFSFSYFYDDIDVGQFVEISINGIDKQFYDYIEILIEQSDDGGGLFDAPPATTRGNMVNVTNPDNFPLGYFNISEAFRYNFVIQERD